MECCQGSSLLSWVAVLLPESECKGTAFFLTTKLFRNFFLKKIFQGVKNSKIIAQNFKVACILNTPLSAESGYKVTAKN